MAGWDQLRAERYARQLAAGFGVLGYLFVKLGFEAAPLLLGFVLAKIKLSPLRAHEWALLLLGFMQLPLFIGAAVVLWFFALAWRGSAGSAVKKPILFNLMQIALAGASVIALLCMLGVVHEGLLGRPEMFGAQVAGRRVRSRGF